MLTLAILEHILGQVRYVDWAFWIGLLGEGFFVQVVFRANDPENGGSPAYQRGRKWYVSTHATEAEVVQTALKAVLTALEHEAREQFHYKGKAIFGPHLALDALASIADTQVHRAEVAQA